MEAEQGARALGGEGLGGSWQVAAERSCTANILRVLGERGSSLSSEAGCFPTGLCALLSFSARTSRPVISCACHSSVKANG